MKIFFIASIHGKNKYKTKYEAIIKKLINLGHKVQADHIINTNKQDIADWSEQQDIDFHRKVLSGIKKADIVVAEVSYPSISVGYLISLSVESNKPTIVLYSDGEIPHLLQTLESNEIFLSYKYSSMDELDKELPILLNFASDQQDTRFNFFISPRHQNYLDWIAKNKKIPRSVHLRDLIEKDMAENQEYT